MQMQSNGLNKWEMFGTDTESRALLKVQEDSLPQPSTCMRGCEARTQWHLLLLGSDPNRCTQSQ